MKSCGKCKSVSTMGLFISVCAFMIALFAFFHKIKLTEGYEGGTDWETDRDSHNLVYTHDGFEVMKLDKKGNMTIRGSLTVDNDISIKGDILQEKKPYYVKYGQKVAISDKKVINRIK